MFLNSYNNQRNQQFDSYGNPIKDALGAGDFNSNSNPLAHLNESVNSLDPLNAMEKSLNDQVSFSLHRGQKSVILLKMVFRSLNL